LTNMAHESVPGDAPMTTSNAQVRSHWEARYRAGFIPWDTQITPPEVIDFWRSGRLPRHGIALDLGCGPGTNVRYLAALGLTAIGVELAGPPILTALRRFGSATNEVRKHSAFICTDVCRLPFNRLNATYILDIGCYHSMPRNDRSAYVTGILENLAPGGFYQLYAFDTDPGNPEPSSGPPGVDMGEVAARFTPHLHMVEEIIARPDRRPCRWYLLQRPYS
jgi:hypothetical protein